MPEAGLLTRAECQAAFKIALGAARRAGVSDIEVTLAAVHSSLTRFANNAIHQNVSERARDFSVRVVVDRRTARASSNRFDPGRIQATVDRAIAIAHAAEPDPDLPALAEAEPAAELDRHDTATAASTPAERAEGVRRAVEVVEGYGQNCAGIFSARESVSAVLNSRGVSQYHTGTLAQFSITSMAEDSSGWAKASFPKVGDIEPAALARRAAEKAAASSRPRELEPGRYTVILEPSAVQDLLGQMFFDFGATALRDQRSFLSGRMGARLFGENITIYDDVAHPFQAGAPYDAEGVPRQRLILVKNGIPMQLAYCRQTALLDGAEPTGHGFPVPNEYGEAPVNIVVEGGMHSLEDMIASTERGLLVTRLWYIREVDPYEKIMTGMTRDGTFLVEGGRIVAGVRNFRFNQSLIAMLSQVELLSPAERASGEEAFDMVVPAMKVRDFQFSEVTRF